MENLNFIPEMECIIRALNDRKYFAEVKVPKRLFSEIRVAIYPLEKNPFEFKNKLSIAMSECIAYAEGKQELFDDVELLESTKLAYILGDNYQDYIKLLLAKSIMVRNESRGFDALSFGLKCRHLSANRYEDWRLYAQEDRGLWLNPQYTHFKNEYLNPFFDSSLRYLHYQHLLKELTSILKQDDLF